MENRCVLGDECLCPHVDHGEDECFDADMVEAWEAERKAEAGKEPHHEAE